MSILVSPSPVPNSHSIDLASTVLDRDAYLIDLLNQIVGGVETPRDRLSWLQELRERAVLWVRQSVLPTTRDEEWRFADLSFCGKFNFMWGRRVARLLAHLYDRYQKQLQVGWCLLMVFIHLSCPQFLFYQMELSLAI